MTTPKESSAQPEAALESKPRINAVTALIKLATLFDEYREFFGLSSEQFPELDPQEKQCEYEQKFTELMCEYLGHDIGRDQCGKPEHDLCYRCKRLRTEIAQAQRLDFARMGGQIEGEGE